MDNPVNQQQWPLLFLSQVGRTYKQADTNLHILKGVNLAVWPGELVALVAPSGEGKSTLLHCAALLEKPDSGEVYIATQPTVGLSDVERTAIRRTKIGFIYQFHHLLNDLSALENVMLPQLIFGLSEEEAHKRALEILSFLGLSHRLSHRPSELSGGEQQRVAIARAIANRPGLILGDEATGNLDTKTAENVFSLLVYLTKTLQFAALIATHNENLAAQADRRVFLREGLLVEER